MKYLQIIVGILIMGEALALTLGMQLMGKEGRPWLHYRNVALLAADLVIGALIFILVWAPERYFPALLAALTIGLLTHAWRGIEPLTKSEAPFCFNVPLIAVNALKLTGLIVLSTLLMNAGG